MLTRHAPTSKCTMAASSEWRSSCSCGSKSHTVVPRSRLPRLRIAPDSASSPSASSVLRAPAWPTSAMLRISAVEYAMEVVPLRACLPEHTPQGVPALSVMTPASIIPCAMTKRALIVDDSRSARVILSRMLEGYGLQGDSSDSAAPGLEFLRQPRPDVIFMDHLMPGMDGFQAIQAIKGNPDT